MKSQHSPKTLFLLCLFFSLLFGLLIVFKQENWLAFASLVFIASLSIFIGKTKK